MSSIYVSFIVQATQVYTDNNELLDKSFQSVYKPFIKFLYSHSSFPFSFAISGNQIQYFKRRKNELIAIMRELVDRKQVEIIGGAYNDPLLPLLNSVDRNGQIDLLTSEIRQTFGKRPRGMTLFQDCWDSSLVNNIHNCGLEYVLLDSDLIPEENQTFIPVFMSDLGKNVDIYFNYNEFIPNPNLLAEEFIWNIEKAVIKAEKKDSLFQYNSDRIIVISLNQDIAASLIESKWFEKLSVYLSQNQETRIKLTTPNLYKSQAETQKLQYYIPVGIKSEISNIVLSRKGESKQRFPVTVYDFINRFPAAHKLYNRMLYISMLVNQYKTDKMRKKSAREKLWQAQSGNSLLCTSNVPIENSISRQQAFKYLTEAEKILRGDGKFEESVTCFDYDNDGRNEYVCRMDQYFAYISLAGGSVHELDVIKNNGNYCDNLNRVIDFDNYEDFYERGLFVDHLFTEDQLKKYINGEPAGDGVFSRILYNELKYSQHHHEIQLCARAIWKPTGQTVYLRKKYIINSTGMYVQYIIKNESQKALKAKFAVETNITNISFGQKNDGLFSIETVDNGDVFKIDTKFPTKNLNEEGKLSNINTVRVSDHTNGMSFVFEPNEKCGYTFNPLLIMRNGFDGKLVQPVNQIYVSTLFWDINIEPGMETEKSINFTLVPVKKIKNV